MSLLASYPHQVANILDSLADPLVAFDREWRYTYVSRRAATVLGKTPAELVGRSMWERFPLDADNGFQNACRQAWDGGKPVTIQRYSVVLGHWIEVYIHPFATGASTQWRDITERKRTEELLRESESQFRTLANAIPQLCWIANADGSIFWYNQRWYDYTGASVEQMKGWGWQSVHDPAVLPDVMRRWQDSIATGQPFEMVFPLRGADGVFRSFLTRIVPVRDGDGAIVRWFGTNTDISEHLKTQQDLAAALQRLDAHMENSPLAIIEFDPEFRITRWSDEAQRLFGWTADEVRGRRMTEFPWIYSEDLAAVDHVSRSMIQNDQPRNVSLNRNYRKDGAVLECEWYNSAIYDRNGNLASILSQVLDVTERKHAEERLRQAQKMESIALLAGGVAHDFNNLLVGVIGNASLATEILPEDSPAQEFLARIVKSGEQAAHLTRQLLGYSGKGRFVLERVDLSAVVVEVVDSIRSTAPRKIDIQLEFAPALPAIEADRGQIHQVLMNLVVNATEAIGNQAGVIRVRTSSKHVNGDELQEPELAGIAGGDYVCLEVCDSGCGMSDEVRAKIFDPFFTTKFHGRGLGLAAVAGIVRGHKGAIQVRSTPGRGACFELLFPALAANSPRPETLPDRRSATDLGGSGTVLVIDDEESVRTVIGRGVQRAGYSVVHAGSGVEAIDILGRNPQGIHVAILDLSMPGMSGNEVLPKLLELNPSLEVLITSGHGESDTIRAFGNLRIAGFLQKPFSVRTLLEKLAAIRAHRRRKRPSSTSAARLSVEPKSAP